MILFFRGRMKEGEMEIDEVGERMEEDTKVLIAYLGTFLQFFHLLFPIVLALASR